MNKPEKYKNSSNTLRSVKSVKSSKTKETLAITSRTPKPHSKNSTANKKTLHKFKSIPTIAFAERDSLLSPPETYKNTHRNGQNYKIHSGLLYSVSERRDLSTRKDSLLKYQKSFKNMSNHVTSVNKEQAETNLQKIYKRTQNILDSYKIKEQIWRKEKKHLLKELERYKKKSGKEHPKKNTSYVTKTLKSM